MSPTAEILEQYSGPHAEVAEIAYPAGVEIAPHSHEEDYFIVVLHGAYREWAGGEWRTCSTHSVIYRPAGEIHRTHFDSAAARCLRIRLAPSWLVHAGKSIALPPRSLNLGRGEQRFLGPRLYRGLWPGLSPTPADIDAAALELAVAIAPDEVRRGPSPPRWLDRVVDAINEGYSEPVRVDELARLAGVHPVHLGRVFQAQIGSSIADYTRRLRVARACRELRSSSRSITSIALLCGFCDQSHLCRAFRAFTGMTPAGYRSHHLN